MGGTQPAVDVEALYRRFAPMVLRRCRALLGDEARAEELHHDVFVAVLKAAPRLEDRGLSSLLFTTATRLCLNALRDRARRPEEATDDDWLQQVAALDDPTARTWMRITVDRVFGRVPDETRTVAVLRFVDGMTLDEVADAMNLSPSAVRRRLAALERAGLSAPTAAGAERRSVATPNAATPNAGTREEEAS